MKQKICVPVGASVKLITARFGDRKVISYVDKIYICVDTYISVLGKQLMDADKEFSDEYSNIMIAEESCGCPCDCDCGPDLVLYGTREENDIEYEYRTETEAVRKDSREAQELAAYEKLKLKFEGK